MIKSMGVCCLLLFLPVSGFQKNPTLTAMADNTLMTIPGGGDCGAYAYCREGSSCRTCCEYTILDFSGMVYDFHRHKILAFGGGHATGCFPSNVAEFDIATLKWSYLINIDSTASCNVLYAQSNLIPGKGGFTYSGKIFAGSRHSYDGLLMAPDSALMICAESSDFAGCDALNESYNYWSGAGLWVLDPLTRLWSVSASSSLGVIYSYSAADPAQPDDYFAGGGLGGNEFYRINWKTEQKTTRASPPVFDVDMSMEYYPGRKSFLAFPTTNLCEYNIAQNTWTRLTPSGTAPNCYSLNVCYDTLNKVFCCFYNNDFYYYSPVRNQWYSMGKNFVIARPFHHHIYDPVDNVHIVAGNGGDEGGGWQTYVYKFSDTPGKFPGTGLAASVTRAGTGTGGGIVLDVSSNPLNADATIRITGLAGHGAELFIYDARGKCVDRTIAANTGISKDLYWNVKGLGSGIYVVKMKTGPREISRKLLVQR